MPIALLRPASGVVDGTNREFLAAASYVPGSVQVFLNGQLLTASRSDGWEELPPQRVRLKQAPLPGDKVEIYCRVRA